MLLVYVALASVCVGWLRGGKLRHMQQTPFYGLWLPIASFGLEALIGPLVKLLPVESEYWLWAVVLSEYLLLAVFLYCNRHLKAVWMLAGGTAVNFLVISLNHWKMPVSRDILSMPELSGFVDKMTTGTLVEYALIEDGTRLWWLGDVIHFDFIPGMSFASVGDFLLGVGIFWLLQTLMTDAGIDEKKK